MNKRKHDDVDHEPLVEDDELETNDTPLPQENEIEPAVIVSDSKSTYRINKVAPQALVVHCADPRFQDAFRKFVTNELGITNYSPIIIGGGVHALGMQSFLPKNFKILWEQIKFFIKKQQLTQVIIINHEDCAWYEKMKGYHPKIDKLLKGKLDVLTAAKVILGDFPLVEVRAFWAALDGDEITFTELTDDSLSNV